MAGRRPSGREPRALLPVAQPRGLADDDDPPPAALAAHADGRGPAGRAARRDPRRRWFVFAVVRHPTARLFSAWQSKLLLREPWWVDQYGERPWFPRVPSTATSCVEDLSRFARRDDRRARPEAAAQPPLRPPAADARAGPDAVHADLRDARDPAAAGGLRAPRARARVRRRAAEAAARERDPAQAAPVAVPAGRARGLAELYATTSSPRLRRPAAGGLDPSDATPTARSRRSGRPDRARRAHQRSRAAGPRDQGGGWARRRRRAPAACRRWPVRALATRAKRRSSAD